LEDAFRSQWFQTGNQTGKKGNTMKTRKLAEKMDNAIESTSDCRQRHQDTLKTYLMQFKTEEEKLNKKLKKATDESSRKKWQEKLGLVREAYEILEA
jgi:predicted RNase H-like nuclease (RuvC/YqgF family)